MAIELKDISSNIAIAFVISLWFLTAIFGIAKLIGIITMPWVWVLSPMWIPMVLSSSIVAIPMVFAPFKYIFNKIAVKRNVNKLVKSLKDKPQEVQ